MPGLALPPTVVATQFVNNAQPMHTADLLSAFPASASVVGMYARVDDLFGSVDDVMRCRYDGTNYRWVPQRESYTGTISANSGSVPFIPLFTPTTVIFTTTSLLGNMNIPMSTTNAYNGQPAEFVAPSGLGLGIYTMAITGLVGSNVSLAAGQTRRFHYGPDGWYLIP